MSIYLGFRPERVMVQCTEQIKIHYIESVYSFIHPFIFLPALNPTVLETIFNKHRAKTRIKPWTGFHSTARHMHTHTINSHSETQVNTLRTGKHRPSSYEAIQWYEPATEMMPLQLFKLY